MTERLILHEYSASGNCYKVRLTAAHLGLPIERREYDILKGETRTPDFLREVSANGRIPVLQVGERFIPESNAACFYLADGTELIPTIASAGRTCCAGCSSSNITTSRTSRRCASGPPSSARPI